jgi:nitrile hydratase subunit beta
MNGIHDMGGMHGFGPVERQANEPVFHAPWHGRVFAMALTAEAVSIRRTIEQMSPARYLASSYYERWLTALETGLLRSGAICREEIEDRTAFFQSHPDQPVLRRENPELAERVKLEQRQWQSLHQDVGVAPRYGVGDAVRARNIHPAGHTRLPRYVRGRRGTIARFHGVHDFPETGPDGRTHAPQPVYAVRFEARELWGKNGGEHDSIYVDLWESYLEAV